MANELTVKVDWQFERGDKVQMHVSGDRWTKKTVTIVGRRYELEEHDTGLVYTHLYKIQETGTWVFPEWIRKPAEVPHVGS